MLTKGYRNDAGVDVTCNRDIVFHKQSMTVFNLGVGIVPKKNTMAIIAPRSSYAAKGLLICNSPIDADYNGDVHAMVYNAGDEDIRVSEGEAFCQLMIIKIKTIKNVEIRKKGKRGKNNFGSTGGGNR